MSFLQGFLYGIAGVFAVTIGFCLWRLHVLNREEEIANAWHADDCLGYPMCDGCGFIAADMLWYPGPCPEEDQPHQRARSEDGEVYEQ